MLLDSTPDRDSSLRPECQCGVEEDKDQLGAATRMPNHVAKHLSLSESTIVMTSDCIVTLRRSEQPTVVATERYCSSRSASEGP